MKSIYLSFMVSILFFSQIAMAKRVLKVRGKKAYISKKGLNASKGQIISVYADGYKVGKVKLLGLLKGKFWIGKVLSGDVAKGDYLKVKRTSKKGKRGKKKRGRYKSNKGWKDTIYVGGGIIQLDGTVDAASVRGFEFTNHKAVALSYDKKVTLFNKQFMLMFSGIMTLGGNRLLDPLTPGAEAIVFDSKYMEFGAGLGYILNDYIYLKFGLGLAQLSYTQTFATDQDAEELKAGTYTEKFLGAVGGLGIGFKYDLARNLSIKLDASYNANFYLSGSVESPPSDPRQVCEAVEATESAPAKEGGCGGQNHINVLLYLGYKF